MALNNNLIELRRELDIYAILKVPYQFYANMFYDYTDSIAPTTLAFYTLTNCTDGGDGTLTPTSGSFSFRVGSATGILITVSMVATSIQPPNISISQLKTMLGVGYSNISALNSSANINTLSPVYPNATAPHSFSEWIGYYHNAEGGCYLSQIVPSSSVDYLSTYTFGASAGKKHGKPPIGYSWGNTRVDLYKNGVLSKTGTVGSLAGENYVSTTSAAITNNAGGLTTSLEHSAKYYLWNGSSYVLQDTLLFYITLRGQLLIFSYTTAGYSVKTLYGSVSINNQTSSSHTYLVRFQLIRGGSTLETKTISQVVGGDTTYANTMNCTFTNTLDPADTFLIDINTDGGAYEYQASHGYYDG